MEDFKYIAVKVFISPDETDMREKIIALYENNGVDLFFLYGDKSRDLFLRSEIKEMYKDVYSTISSTNLNPFEHGVCYKSGKVCAYNCTGLCKDS